MASEKYRQLIKLVSAAQNRVVSDMLRNAGMKNKVIFGLSMVDLRSIASRFYPDRELADELWERDIRETKIISLLVDDPKKVTKEQVLKRAEEFDNVELAEQAGGYFFPKLPFATEIVETLCQSKNEITSASGFILAGKIAAGNINVDDETLAKYLELTKNKAKDASLPLRRAISTALRLIGRRNKLLNDKATEITKEIERMGTDAAKWIAEDVLLALEMYRERFEN
jgi:3-methyladenine DNA glycosylase AlkD